MTVSGKEVRNERTLFENHQYEHIGKLACPGCADSQIRSEESSQVGQCTALGIVAVRLICPFTIESSVSLIPDSVGSGELVSEWMDDYIDDIDIHHPDSVYYDAAIGAGREPISDGEGGYYVVTKHDQLGEPATIEIRLFLFCPLYGLQAWLS